MNKWGMKVYLDAGQHVALDGRPCYYGGVLTLYQLKYHLRADLNKPEKLGEAQDRFVAARKDLLAEGGGIISIFYHPCEWVHKQFWDGVNFSRGANPPRSEWRLPPAKSADETKTSHRIFADYIRFIKRFGDVEFITASQALKLYPDRARGRRFTPANLKTIAAGVSSEVTFQKHKDFSLSASEVFVLLNDYVAARAAGRTPESVALTGTPYGPTGRVPTLGKTVTTDASQFGRTSIDVADFMRKQGRIPSAVWLGSTAVPPEAYLQALTGVALELLAGKPMPARVEVKAGKLGFAKNVAVDDPKLWGWVIFPPGFRAPAMMDLALRQGWTLKPALLGSSR
jgi:hypothetical protein